jgi:serine/threonine-protein kinase
MGAVHAATDSHTGATVAVKRLLDMTQLARFEIEARLLAQLDHPRVVRVLDHFEEDGAYYLVMTLVEGPSLRQVLKERGAPGLRADEVVEFGAQACEALDYVHTEGIVHRDVKPENLIVGSNGLVLVDFGVARELGADTYGTIAVGTPRFMAPEVFSGGGVSPRSDVFGLAVTLVTLLTGTAPSYTEREPLVGRYPGVSPELDAALRWGREFTPERRIGSAAAMAEALGRPLTSRRGASLVTSLETPGLHRSLLESVVRTAAGVFDAAAASIALVDHESQELVYRASWGAGAREIVGTRLAPGEGITGAAVASSEPVVVGECRADERFATRAAARSGYIPITMMVVPLRQGANTIGALSILDRRDGLPYTAADLPKGQLFAELAVAVLGEP